MYYGEDETCTYDAGTSEGTAVTPLINLHNLIAPIYLSFAYFLETEQAPWGYDIATVEIAQDGGAYTALASNNASPGVMTLADPANGWQHAFLDLSDYAGSTIQIRFRFQTIDNWLNDYPGFYVDDVMLHVTLSDTQSPMQSILGQLCQALNPAQGCEDIVDMNGPEGGPNGIPDAAELALIEALLQDPTLDFSPFGGIQANGAFIATWLGNLQTMQTLLAGSNIELFSTLLAAFITLGDDDSVQFVVNTVQQLAQRTLDPNEFDLTQQHFLSYRGDADHDGINNLVSRTMLVEGPCIPTNHTSDQNADYLIGLSELLRVIQFFNFGGFHGQSGTEDGYAPGSSSDKGLPPLASTTAPAPDKGLPPLVRTWEGEVYPSLAGSCGRQTKHTVNTCPSRSFPRRVNEEKKTVNPGFPSSSVSRRVKWEVPP